MLNILSYIINKNSFTTMKREGGAHHCIIIYVNRFTIVGIPKFFFQLPATIGSDYSNFYFYIFWTIENWWEYINRDDQGKK